MINDPRNSKTMVNERSTLDEHPYAAPANESVERNLVAQKGENDSSADCMPNALSCCLSTLCPVSWLGAPLVLDANDGVVVLYFGKIFRVLTEPGFYWMNPMGRETRRVSLKQKSVDLPKSKVIDLSGNPLIVSAAITYRVVDVTRAALAVDDYDNFVESQALAVMKRVCSAYPYESDDDQPSLKSEASHIAEGMVNQLQSRIDVAGIKILTFSLTDLSYAPEVAAAMLVKQQAEALIRARKLIVTGAVDIAAHAVSDLETKGLQVSESERVKIVSNLLTVICGDSNVQPTVNM